MRQLTYRTVVTLLGLSALALTTACSGSASSSLSPTSPSGLSAPSSSGATITGQVNGGSGLTGLAFGTQAVTSTNGLTVTVEGTTITAAVDGGGRFTLSGLPEGTHRLSFKGPNADARVTVTVGANESVAISVTVNGSDARVESEHRTGPSSGKSELEGLVTEALAGTPNTLRVAGALVNVPSTATIRHGGTTLSFAAIKVGDRVHVRGTRTATGFDATEVNVQNQNGSSTSETDGVVSGLAGVCPALTFKVGTRTVKTDGATYFRDGGCKDLLNGDRVEVKGTIGSDGVLTATVVKNEDAEDDDDDDDDDDDGDRPGVAGAAKAEGVVSAKAGTCPALTFMLGSTKVVTNAATKFDGIACAAVLDGRRVEAKGTRQSNNDLLATKVEPQS